MSNIKIFAAVILIITVGLSFFYQKNFGTPHPVSYTSPEEAYEQGRYFNLQSHLDPSSPERIEENRKSDAQALRFAAERGHLKAASKLGEMYANGIGVKKNMVEALKWYEAGAAEFDIEDIYNLVKVCDFHRTGLGVPINYPKALEYCQRAAQYSWSDPKYRMSDFYFNGWAVEKDIEEAYFWMALANYWEFPQSKRLLAEEEKLAALLSDKNKKKVMVRVYQWTPKDVAESKTPEMLEHCQRVLGEARAKQAVSDDVAEKCLRKCVLQLRPQDPRFSTVKSCPYWKRTGEK